MLDERQLGEPTESDTTRLARELKRRGLDPLPGPREATSTGRKAGLKS
jgi:hypothetical protein